MTPQHRADLLPSPDHDAMHAAHLAGLGRDSETTRAPTSAMADSLPGR